MNKYFNFIAILSVALILSLIAADRAHASVSNCVQPGWINIAGNGMDAQVRLTNNVSCGTMTVSVCSYRVYQFPTGTVGWLKNQTLLDSKTVTLKPGEVVYTTVKTDNCMTQIDLFEGPCVYPFPSDNPHDLSTIVGGQITKYHVLCEKCTNECDSVNQKVCSGNSVKTCVKGSDGCNRWKLTDCSAGMICRDGECAASCTDECSTNGKRECYGNGFRTCGNHDSDSCLEWGSVTNCDSDETCSNGSCVKTCTDECSTNGKRECYGNGFRTCGNHDSDSCLEWGSVTNCGASQTCVNGSCVDDYDEPTVNLTSTGDGSCGTGFTLKWISTDTTSCAASGAWSGSLSTNGSKKIAGFDGTRTFTIKCWGKGGTATDTITLTGNGDDDLEVDAGDDVTIDEGESVKLRGTVDGDYDDLEWDCNGGDLDDEDTLRPTFEAPSKRYDYDKVYTCTLTAKNECGEDSDTVKIRVNADDEDEDMRVSLSADPSSGCAALNDVDLTAEVDDDSKNEKYKYYFDCDDDGDWDKTASSDNDSYTARNLCDYKKTGTYTAKVKVTSNGRSATDTVSIRVKDCDTKEEEGRLSIDKTVRSIGGGSAYAETISTNPGDIVSYRIEITAKGGDVDDVVVTDVMPAGIYNRRNVRLEGSNLEGNLGAGINIGDISKGETKTITYDATVANADYFNYGQTQMTNTATVETDGSNARSEATVIVQKSAIAGATIVSTGFGGGSALAVIAGLMAVLTAILIAFRGNAKAMYMTVAAHLKGNTEVKLAKRIDYVKRNNLIGQ